MIHFVTPLLRIDEENGKCTTEEAKRLLLSKDVALVPNEDVAKEVLMFFGLSETEAEERVFFAKTGMILSFS